MPVAFGRDEERPDRTELEPHIQDVELFEEVVERDRSYYTSGTHCYAAPEPPAGRAQGTQGLEHQGSDEE